MSAVPETLHRAEIGRRGAVVNDFSINVATVNGTGSQTANLTIMRALFKMGIPVNGKNLFPSNIQGLPTWFQIRVSRDGYTARHDVNEILVAFNPNSLINDVKELPSGGVCIAPDNAIGFPDRDDIIVYRIPVQEMMRDVTATGKLKDYLTNMIYVGALAQLLAIPLEMIDAALMFHFGNSRRKVESNMQIIRNTYDWTAEHIVKQDPFTVAPLNLTEGKMLITGNEAAGLGALAGGVTLVAWYPITPSTSLVDAVNEYRDALRDRDSLVVMQAEDELSAIGMVVGAGWAGGRAMTATSGPGVSLMAEFAGLSYFAEIPAVIWDVQRVGPSTGLPTRTGQGDLLFSYYLGHGDTKHVILLPGTPEECFNFGIEALNLAEQLQTLVLVLSDLDLGMNYWMSESFALPAEPLKRGKVLTAEQVTAQSWGRYKDVDGDGIAYRTLPGNPNPLAAYMTRGTGHDEYAKYSENPDVWVANLARLNRKFETARTLVPAPLVQDNPDASIGLLYFGTTWPAVDEARDLLAADGIQTAAMRLRALPFSAEVRRFIEQYDRVYVIEMNRDAQLLSILRSELPDLALKLRSIAFMNGLPLTGPFVEQAVRAQESGN